MPIYIMDILDPDANDEAFRPVVADYGGDWTVLCDGRADPTLAGGRMIVRCADNPAFGSDPRIAPISHELLTANGAPDDNETDEDALTYKVVRRFLLRQWLRGNDLPPVDLTIGDIAPAKRQAAIDLLQIKGISLTGIGNGTTIADALRQILPQIKVSIHTSAVKKGGTFTDDASGTTQSDLTAHTPSGGTSWTRDGTADAVGVASGVFVGGSGIALYICDDQGGVNHYSQGDLLTNITPAGPAVRAQDSNNTFYVAFTGSSIIRMERKLSGSLTHLINASGNSPGSTARYEVSGNTHGIFYNSVQLGSDVTDANLNTETSQGIYSHGTTNSFLDNFEAGLLAGGFQPAWARNANVILKAGMG